MAKAVETALWQIVEFNKTERKDTKKQEILLLGRFGFVRVYYTRKVNYGDAIDGKDFEIAFRACVFLRTGMCLCLCQVHLKS